MNASSNPRLTARGTFGWATGIAVLLAGILAAPPPASAAQGWDASLLRYPWLTDLTSSSLTVMWASSVSTSGSVTYGASGSCTGKTATAARNTITVGSVTEYQWKATMTGLAANASYCYRVSNGGTDLLGSDSSPTFTTMPSAGSATPFSFAVVGDFGDTSSGPNADQANVMSRISDSGARFAVTVGDIAYPDGTQLNYGDLDQTGLNTSAIFGPDYWKVPGSHIPLFVTVGNHGLTSTLINNWKETSVTSSSGGVYGMVSYPAIDGTTPASYPTTYYAVQAGNVRIYVLDVAWADQNHGSVTEYQAEHDAHWTVSSAEYKWLSSDLQSHPGGVKFAVFHYPIYSDNPTETADSYLQGPANLEGLLSDNGVDIAFTGHSHIYERNKPQVGNLVTYVSGTSGAIPEPVSDCQSYDAYALGWSPTTNSGSACGAAPTPASPSSVYHFLLVSVSGTSVTVTPTDENGNTFDVQHYDFRTTQPPDPADPSTTAISATPNSVPADGTSTSTITVQAKDAAGVALTTGGDNVVLSADDGKLSGVTNHGNGTYTATLTSSTTAGTATVTGTINGATISATAMVAFTAVGGGGTGGGGSGGGGGGGGSGSGSGSTGTVTAGGSFSSDPAGTVPSASDPMTVTITSPDAGAVSVTKTSPDTTLAGYRALNVGADITAPMASASAPLRLAFSVYVGGMPSGSYPGDVTVFRNGVAAQACSGGTTATPDPCVSASSVGDGVETVTVLSSHASSWEFQAADVGRIAGSDRYAMAVAASQAEFPMGGAGAVVLASGENYPDALVGGPLAVAKNAPLLLTESASLPSSTKNEIKRVLPPGGTVYVLGGNNAVSSGVATELAAMGFQVTRYGGADRYQTAVMVAEALGDPSVALLATGTNFPDALSAGVAAARVNGAVLLTDGAILPTTTREYLAAHGKTVYAVGGPAAMADSSATAIAGADRYGTAVAVAMQFFGNPVGVGVASGLGFPDALSGGVLLARAGVPLVLAATDGLPTASATYLSRIGGGVVSAHLFGGTAALAQPVEQQLQAALGE